MSKDNPYLGMSEAGPSGAQKFVDWIKDNHAQQPTLSSELIASVREAVKDVRQTMNEFFFSQGEHAPEPGTPMVPTQAQLTERAGNFHGFNREDIEIG